jgi:hypothetical protein
VYNKNISYIQIYSKSNLIQNYKSYNNICKKYINATGSTSGGGTAYLSGVPDFSLGVTISLVLCVMFCRSLFVLLSFFFWPLYWLSFFDLRILFTPLVFSNSSVCLLKRDIVSNLFWSVIVVWPSVCCLLCLFYNYLYNHVDVDS